MAESSNRRNLRIDFAIVVLSVHDNDKMCRDVDAPAEWTRGHHNLNSPFIQKQSNNNYKSSSLVTTTSEEQRAIPELKSCSTILRSVADKPSCK